MDRRLSKLISGLSSAVRDPMHVETARPSCPLTALKGDLIWSPDYEAPAVQRGGSRRGGAGTPNHSLRRVPTCVLRAPEGPRKRSSLYMRHYRKHISGSPLPDLAPDNIPLALVQPRPGVDLSLCSVLVGALVVSARCGNLPPTKPTGSLVLSRARFSQSC